VKKPIGFCFPRIRWVSLGLGAFQEWRTTNFPPSGFSLFFFSVFFEMVRRWLNLEVRIKYSIFALSSLWWDAWSCVSHGSPRILSVFVSVDVIFGMVLLIYKSHL
jgi:hypothetical protein